MVAKLLPLPLIKTVEGCQRSWRQCYTNWCVEKPGQVRRKGRGEIKKEKEGETMLHKSVSFAVSRVKKNIFFIRFLAKTLTPLLYLCTEYEAADS